MKSLYLTFSDTEFYKLRKLKKSLGKTWEHLLIFLAFFHDYIKAKRKGGGKAGSTYRFMRQNKTP